MSPTLAEILKPTVFMARVIWFALTAAIPTYVFVASILARDMPSRPVDPIVVTVFGVLSVVVAVAAIVLPRFFPSGEVLRALMATDPSDDTLARDPRSGTVDAGVVAALKQLDARERLLLVLRPVFTTQAIVRSALAEAIAVFGFVLVVMSGSFNWMLPFAAISLVVQLMLLPRFEPFAERALEFAGG